MLLLNLHQSKHVKELNAKGDALEHDEHGGQYGIVCQIDATNEHEPVLVDGMTQRLLLLLLLYRCRGWCYIGIIVVIVVVIILCCDENIVSATAGSGLLPLSPLVIVVVSDEWWTIGC